jgi:hypothetical protein
MEVGASCSVLVVLDPVATQQVRNSDIPDFVESFYMERT